MEEKADVVIIGSGPAGCVAGAYLATRGLKTVVLEQHSHVGGEKWGDYMFGDGFHADNHIHIPIWHMTLNEGHGWWAKAARDVGAAVCWTCLPNTGIYLQGRKFIVPYCSNGTAFMKFVADFSPIDIPVDTQKELIKVLDEALSMPQEEVWSTESETTPFITWLGRRTDNEVIKFLLRIFTSMLVIVPLESALEQASITAVVGTIIQGLLGAGMNLTAVLGGTAVELLKSFIDVIAVSGGTVLTNHKAMRVIIDQGKAGGVVALDAEGREKVYEAKYTIAAGGYTALPGLLEENLPQSLGQSVEGFDKVNNTGIDVHFALKRKALDSGCIPYMYVLADDLTSRGHIAFPSNWEPKMAPPEKQMVWTQKFVPTDQFKTRGRDEWIKEMTDMVDGVFPGFKNEIESIAFHACSPAVQYFFSTTPKIPMEHPDLSSLYFVGDYVGAPARGIATERAACSAMMVCRKILGKEGRLVS